MSWIRVNRDKPCPVCGRTDWCSVAANGSVVVCMREPSEKECKSGGWIHVLDRSIKTRVRQVLTRKQPRKSPKEWYSILLTCIMGLDELHEEAISVCLGVSTLNLSNLFMGYYPDTHTYAYTFPMWSGKGKLIGIRIRDIDGNYWCWPESQNGLFIPRYLTQEGPLFIVEGPTDCGAALDLGFDSIGRFNCCGGIKDVQTYIKRHKRRDVVIMADNDAPKKRQDGSEWFPGWEGAMRLKESLSSITERLRCVKPPVKDLRRWYNQGATKKDVLELIK